MLFCIFLIFSVKATVLEEMPPFPERESSILAKLKKKKQEKTGIIEKEEKSEPVEKPTANGQLPVVNEVLQVHIHVKSLVMVEMKYDLLAASCVNFSVRYVLTQQ